uniref:DUF4283 domain-containing protein n=1 Tax=Populus trichocarpa TaxID=3694 RepID=A0A2K1Y9R9_POPTR
MTKSKTKTSLLKSVQGDFSLQVPRHGSASRATRALSRSRLPVQQDITSASPIFTTPRKKAVLADFASPSSGVRVSSKHRNISMQRNSSSHSSSAPSACNEGSSGNFRPNIALRVHLAGSHPRGYAPLLHFIGKHWQYKANFTMHDSGWLIFVFHYELEMPETLSSGPYFVFGRPLILKVMPEFFDFQASDMTKLPTWVKLPNLPLRCWTPLCLSKLAGMIGKPIHCDVPTANMTRLSYARILIEVDLLQELLDAIQVVLPNGTPFSQQVTYESLPRFCKRCRVIGHSANTCNRAVATSDAVLQEKHKLKGPVIASKSLSSSDDTASSSTF